MKQSTSTVISLSHIINTRAFKHEKAYQIYAPVPKGTRKSTTEFHLYDDVAVQDCRTCDLATFSLDTHGFQFWKLSLVNELTIPMIQSDNGREKMDAFLTELEPLFREKLGAEQTILYDWRLRSSRSKITYEEPPTADRALLLPPASHIHADESGDCGYSVVNEHLTEVEQQKLASRKWRVRIVNIWKPLVPVVQDRPLALCDWRSVESNDWELCDQIHTDRCDEAMFLKRRDQHRWFWLSDQKTDELSIFTVWDSVKFFNGEQASVPHAAFKLPEEPGQIRRESIEIRSIVWTKL